MQVIEKVKVVPEGYNGAGMNYDGGNRRDVNGKANAGLTLGIIGTALGAWALFGVYIDGRNRTDALIEKNNTDHFNLYKYTRNADDDIRKELSDLKAELAVTKAIRPYQDKLIQCEMEKMFTAGINYTDRKTCNVIYGVVTLPNKPTVTGLVGRNAYGCLPCGFTQPASGTPAQ
ncbi:MAG: hypothetical protein [Bacteriophage sp.]|nr:MAG: hypothetical protein [Bacteriophage sp.]